MHICLLSSYFTWTQNNFRHLQQTKYQISFEPTQVCDFGRNVIVTGRLRRQTKHRNIAVMAMEAEKVEESSKRLEMSVSISQDALEEADVSNLEDSPSPDLVSSSPNLYCRQIPLSSNISRLPICRISSKLWLKDPPVGFQVSIFLIKPNWKWGLPLISPKLSNQGWTLGLILKQAPYQGNFCNYPEDLKPFANMFLSLYKTCPCVALLLHFDNLIIRQYDSEQSNTYSPLTCRATTPLPFSSPPALTPHFDSPTPDLSQAR